MLMLIYHLVSGFVLAFLVYAVLYTINYKILARLVVMVTIVTMIGVAVKDLAPVIQGLHDSATRFNERIDKLQGTVDTIDNIGKGGWEMPMKGEISQGFKGADHHGMDIGAPLGTSVEATRKGVVTRVEWNDIYGNMIVVDHGGGTESLYGHLQGLNVKVEYPVIAGTKIGTCGGTGNSTGPHLHFEIRKNSMSVDPLQYLK